MGESKGITQLRGRGKKKSNFPLIVSQFHREVLGWLHLSKENFGCVEQVAGDILPGYSFTGLLTVALVLAALGRG